MVRKEVPAVRDYPDIPARVVGDADAAAAQAIWEAVAEWWERDSYHNPQSTGAGDTKFTKEKKE